MSDLIRKTIGQISPADLEWREKAKERIIDLTMPPWALGRLLDLAVDIAGITRSLNPPIKRRTVVIMAGDHGVATEGVSPYPQAVTLLMIRNFAELAGAGINVLARQAKAKILVVDMGVAGDVSEFVKKGLVIDKHIANGTKNMVKEPAMTRDEAIRSIEAGIEIALKSAKKNDILATGDMGIGNTTSSSAIVSVICRMNPEAVTCRGAGIDEEGRLKKAEIISKAIALNSPNPDDPIDILSKVGGFEIGAIAGFILGAASMRKPVLVDGFISTAGALLANEICPHSTDYMIASHQSMERGHHAALEKLKKKPFLSLNLRLGEGTGAVLAMHFVESAVLLMNEMATWEKAGISKK